MAFIDGTVVNVALPALQTQLHASVVDVQWVIESYSLLLAALLLVGGSLGDHYGRRRVFVIGVTVFAAASMWCGFAPGIGQLVLARAMQGVGAALLVPGSLAIISSSFRQEDRGRAVGTWSGFTAITAAIGPVLGGWLVEHVSWRAVFVINIPLALIVIAISLAHVPESSSADKQRLDWAGAAFIGSGLGTLVYALIESSRLGFAHPMVVTGFIAAGDLIITFIVWELRVRNPMLPLTLFSSRTFAGANPDPASLRRARRYALFPAAQSDPGAALLADGCGRRVAAVYHHHVSTLALVGRTRASLRREAATRLRPAHRRHGVRALYRLGNRRDLLDFLFSGGGGPWNRHGDKRRAAHHDGDEFSRRRSRRDRLGGKQRSLAHSRIARDRGPRNRDVAALRFRAQSATPSSSDSNGSCGSAPVSPCSALSPRSC